MASIDVPVGSFAFFIVGEGEFVVRRLEVAPFDPNTADARIHSCASERYVKKTISSFNFSVGAEVVIPRRRDVASLCPFEFSFIYVDQFRAGLSFPIFPFLRVLRHYGIALSQLQLNGVRVVVAFYLYCCRREVLPTVPIFRTFFILKAATPRGWFFFSSRGKLKVTIPNKVSDWKKKFFYVRVPGQEILRTWRVDYGGDVFSGNVVPSESFRALDRSTELNSHFTQEELAQAGVFMDVSWCGFNHREASGSGHRPVSSRGNGEPPSAEGGPVVDAALFRSFHLLQLLTPRGPVQPGLRTEPYRGLPLKGLGLRLLHLSLCSPTSKRRRIGM